MNIQKVNTQNFEGKLVIVNTLSEKPQKCLDKVFGELKDLIKPKEYDLYFRQDYSNSRINISAEYPLSLKPEQSEKQAIHVQNSIPITSKLSKYIETSVGVIKEIDDKVKAHLNKEWEQQQKNLQAQQIIDMIQTVVLFPVYIAETVIYDLLHCISPKGAEKYRKFTDKIGI